MEEILIVYINNKPIGKLWLEDRFFCFQYTSLNTPPLSVSLPVREEPYLNDKPRAYFANLLPEGLAREAITRQLRLAYADDFGLLRAIGGDCAGAVRIFPGDEEPTSEGNYEELTESELTDLVANLNTSPLGKGKMRLSLAGAQTKVPIRIKGEKFYVPIGGAPSTHIIKVSPNYFPDTVENETFTMMLAKASGLNVPEVTMMRFGNVTGFVITRYDRHITENNAIRRLIQEDFCQVLGLEPEVKYQNSGGPGLAECFEILDNYSSDSIFDREQLLRWTAFNIAVGNADAHAKNLSLLYTKDGIRLSPFYDLVSTVVYGEKHDEEFAMSIDGEWDSMKISEGHWEGLAAEIGSKKSVVLRTVKDMYGRIKDNLESTLATYEHQFSQNSTVREIVHIIAARLTTLM